MTFLRLFINTPEIFAKIIDTHIVSLKVLAHIASTHRSCHHAPEIRARYGILKKANFVCEATEVLDDYVGANARPSALFESDPDRAEIFLAAACINPTRYGDALQYASQGLKNDHEIVLAAVILYPLHMHHPKFFVTENLFLKLSHEIEVRLSDF
uniref:DUF4116 domain-containing protein n=1 Tax=Aureoumbra lagunensis TaxID=44058 RepID=A0A7S3NK61_9STRA